MKKRPVAFHKLKQEWHVCVYHMVVRNEANSKLRTPTFVNKLYYKKNLLLASQTNKFPKYLVRFKKLVFYINFLYSLNMFPFVI